MASSKGLLRSAARSPRRFRKQSIISSLKSIVLFRLRKALFLLELLHWSGVLVRYRCREAMTRHSVPGATRVARDLDESLLRGVSRRG
jgi:hypothetical protein